MSQKYHAKGDRYSTDQVDLNKPSERKCWSLWFILPCCYCVSIAIILSVGIPFAFYVHSLYFDCAVDPPDHGGLHRIWDNKSRYSGIAVNYLCEEMLSDDVVLTHVCSYGNWTITLERTYVCDEMRNRRECADDPPPQDLNRLWDWNKWSRNAGKKIKYMCSTAADAPVYKIVVCSEKTLQWETISDTPENCLCGPPIIYSPPLSSDWDGQSVEMGTTITYECTTNLGRKSFQKLTCSTSAKWQIIETGSCFFFVHSLMNFTNAADYCQQLGTDMLFIENDGEQDEVKSLLSSDHNYMDKCKTKAFLGFRENVNKQWETDDGIYLSGISELWSVNDDGREKCVVMVGPDWRFNNELCQMEFCYVCEVLGPKSPKVDCPDKKTCYVLGVDKGDYRFSNNRCQGLKGQLARVVNIGIMETVKTMINKDPIAKGCKGFYVGIRNQKRYYERLNGQQITYQRFGDDNARSMTRHCAVVDEFFRYDWMDESCSLNSCFMCKAIGYPLRFVVRKGLKMQLSQDMLAIIAAEEESFKRRRRQSKAKKCKDGWAILNDQCVYFNTNEVSRNEAIDLCNSWDSELALDLDFKLHALIARAIYTNGDPQRRPYWHVGFPNNCSSGKCIVVSGCYLLDAFTGRATDSAHNCERKAPFVCCGKN